MNRIVCTATVAMLLLAACGSSSTTRASAPVLPKPVKSIDSTASMIAAASSDESCQRLKVLNHSYLKPADPAKQLDQCKGFLALLKGFKAIKKGQYGTGAVIDYIFTDQSGKRPIYSMLLAIDKDRAFKFFAVEGEHRSATVGTAPADVSKFDRNVVLAIKAIRKGDCDGLYDLAHPGLAPGVSDKAEFCSQYVNSGLQQALIKDPGAIPLRMGANSLYAFYALRIKPDRYYTVILGLKDGGPRFISEIRAEGL